MNGTESLAWTTEKVCTWTRQVARTRTRVFYVRGRHLTVTNLLGTQLAQMSLYNEAAAKSVAADMAQEG